MQKREVENFVTVLFSSEFDLKCQAADARLQKNCLSFCTTTMLVFSFNIGLVIMFLRFLKKLLWKFDTYYTQTQHSAKTTSINNHIK